MATTADLEARMSQLSMQMAQLATKSQLQDLLAALAAYKNTTDAVVNTLAAKVTALETRLNDIEGRLQALE